MKTRFKLAATLALTASLTAFADVKVNEYFSVNGYAVGSYTNTDFDAGGSTKTYLENGAPGANSDAVKLGLLAAKGPFSAYGSILYLPGAANPSNEAGMLDAYGTYDTGTGLKVTGGKFLSYLGYEAFDPVNMAQITYGSTIFAIPAYHTGGKLDYATKTFSLGLAVVDSVFGNPYGNGFFEGDREYGDDLGWEAIATYTGIPKLTIFAGVAAEDDEHTGADVMVYDVWASYALTDKLTIAGEWDKMDDVGDGWLAFLSYKFSDMFSSAFRVSGAKFDAGGDETKYTVAPTVTFSPNLSLRAEYTMAKRDAVLGDDYDFVGVQVLFKF